MLGWMSTFKKKLFKLNEEQPVHWKLELIVSQKVFFFTQILASDENHQMGFWPQTNLQQYFIETDPTDIWNIEFYF